MKTNMDFTGQRPGLFDLPPVLITELTGKEFGDGLSKPQLILAASARLRQLQQSTGAPNNDTEWDLRINKNSRKKIRPPDIRIYKSMGYCISPDLS